MANVKAKLDHEEMDHQSDQEKVMNSTKKNNAPSSEEAMPNVNAENGGQNDNILNNNIGGTSNGDIINGDIWWELEDINRMDTLTVAGELLEEGGLGNWPEWDFSFMNYEENNDWVIDDLWTFDDDHHGHHQHCPSNNNGDAAANTKDPKD